MEKIKTKNTLVIYGNYVIEIADNPISNTIDFWLFNDNYGIKMYLFGLDKKNKKDVKNCLYGLLSSEDIENYISIYQEKYED